MLGRLYVRYFCINLFYGIFFIPPQHPLDNINMVCLWQWYFASAIPRHPRGIAQMTSQRQRPLGAVMMEPYCRLLLIPLSYVIKVCVIHDRHTLVCIASLNTLRNMFEKVHCTVRNS